MKAQKLYASADVQFAHFLSFDEEAKGGEWSAAIMDAKIDSLMDIADKDGNGFVSYKEFYDLVIKAITNAGQNNFWERSH